MIGREIFGARGLPKIRIIAGRWIEDVGGCKSRNSAIVAQIDVLVDVPWIQRVEEEICIFNYSNLEIGFRSLTCCPQL